MASEEIAIGIDLGTTNSCVAVFQNGTAEVIPNEFGERITPSFVIVTKDNIRYVGKEAINYRPKHRKNVIYESKRLIGRKFSEQCIQDRMLHWPFKVLEIAGELRICVPQKNKQRAVFYPEEISAMILEKMKSIAEEHLKRSVDKAVITVPAYFNDNQRKATIDSARIAHLEVLKIMNEPTAAAFTYILKNGLTDTPSITLVFDLGGGTFDVSIIESSGKSFKVLAVNGNPDLGGADYDLLIYNEIVGILHTQVKEPIVLHHAQKDRLMAQCIKVKERLSVTNSADFEVDNFMENFDFHYTFERKVFEKLIKHSIKNMMHIVKETLSAAEVTADDVDNIVLVGGSTKIPAIKTSLREFFQKDLSHAVNPDEAVACGAAYQAAILLKSQNSTVKDVDVVDVTPFSLGIEANETLMDVLIKRNTQLPAKFTKRYTTMKDNQTALRLKVFQGEDARTENNTQLSYFDLTGIPNAPAGVPQIYVTFCINTDGVLHVTAIENSCKEKKDIKIKINTGRLSEEDISRVANKNREQRQKQAALKRTEQERNGLLKFCFDAKRTIKTLASISEEDKEKFINKDEKLITYLEHLSVDQTDLQTLCIKKEEIKKMYYELIRPL